MALLYRLKLDNAAKYFALGADVAGIVKGDFVVAKRDFSLEIGRVVDIVEGDPSMAVNVRKNGEPPQVIRKATPADMSVRSENLLRSEKAVPVVKRIVRSCRLPMKVLNVLYSLDGKVCAIQFFAEGRVDFRELLKELASALSCRIDLRQISVRDETAAVGGLGCCGNTLCCARFLNEFDSINLKMAKDQDISLNAGRISGICGRLKCCLKFEHEAYLELQKGMPRCGDVCQCKEGRGRVCDRNLLSRRVSLSIADNAGNTRVVHLNQDRDALQVVSRARFADNDAESGGK